MYPRERPCGDPRGVRAQVLRAPRLPWAEMYPREQPRWGPARHPHASFFEARPPSLGGDVPTRAAPLGTCASPAREFLRSSLQLDRTHGAYRVASRPPLHADEDVDLAASHALEHLVALQARSNVPIQPRDACTGQTRGSCHPREFYLRTRLGEHGVSGFAVERSFVWRCLGSPG